MGITSPKFQEFIQAGYSREKQPRKESVEKKPREEIFLEKKFAGKKLPGKKTGRKAPEKRLMIYSKKKLAIF